MNPIDPKVGDMHVVPEADLLHDIDEDIKVEADVKPTKDEIDLTVKAKV